MIPQLLPCPSQPLHDLSTCEICYEPADKWQILPCTHKLCNQCYTKLQANSCPWCRAPLGLKNKRRSPPVDDDDDTGVILELDLLTIIDIEFDADPFMHSSRRNRRRNRRHRNQDDSDITTRRPRSESDPGPYHGSGERHELNTPEEVVNYEREATRRINARRRASQREKINGERDHPGKRKHRHGGRRDFLSRRRSPIENARNAATRNTRGV